MPPDCEAGVFKILVNLHRDREGLLVLRAAPGLAAGALPAEARVAGLALVTADRKIVHYRRARNVRVLGA